MKSEIPCEVIEDLLPLYVEQLTKEKTNIEIKKHFIECEECHSLYEKMSANLNEEKTGENKSICTNLPEINYLKKIKKNNRKKVVIGILSTILLMVTVIGLKLFVWGYPISNYTVNVDRVGNMLTIKGTMVDSGNVYRKYQLKQTEEGNELIIFGCLPSIFKSSGDFQIEYPLTEGDISFQGMKVLRDGTIISKKAVNLFEAQNPYIGDMSANLKLASILKVGYLGKFENQLQTTQKPYSWTFKFKDAWDLGKEKKNNAIMESYAYVLLSLIDNCEEISWTYNLNGEIGNRSITKKDASAALGADVKEFVNSPQSVQALLDFVGIK